MPRIDAFLKLGSAQGCSDVHLAVGVPPMLRMNGDLVPIRFRELAAAELEAYVTEILTRNLSDRFRAGHDVDFSYVSEEGGRFRVNVFRKDSGVGAVFRTIPAEVPTLDSLALPPLVKKLCDYHQGMILVTGSTGTGKSTTLAAMIDMLNMNKKLNIISLEDPIEFVHRSKQSQVVQRELGTHLPTFAEGVRAAMREDPDVILVGELRDPETISMAMTAAETGHLVLGTLHTTSAVKTIDRMIDALPADQREQTKSFLAQSLIAVITQLLVKRPEGRGRRAVCEIMLMNRAIAKLIQTDQSHQIPAQLQTGKDVGMELMDQALLRAIKSKEVDPDDAYTYATDKRLFSKFVVDRSLLPRFETPGIAGPALAEDRRVPRGDPQARRLRPALHGRGPAAHPPVRQARRLARRAAAPPTTCARAIYEIMPRKALDRFETRDGTDFAYSLGTLARFRVNVLRQLERPRRRVPRDPLEGADARAAQDAGSRAQPRQGLERPDPGDRQDRLRQVDDARGDDRRPQFAHQGTHPDDRGPDRVRARAQELPDQPARGRRARRVLCGCAALGPARGSGRHPGRRAPGPRDDLDRDHGRRDGHPRDGDAAHERRGGDGRPHRQRLPGGQAEPRAHDALDVAARRRLAAADLAQGLARTRRRARAPRSTRRRPRT